MPSDERILLLNMRTAGRSQLAAWLTRLGYVVTIALDLAAAQAIWDRKVFPIIIADAGDQPASIAQLRMQMPGSTIIVIGRRRLADALEAWHAGADDYLPRPVRQHELASALERVQHARAAAPAQQQPPLGSSGLAEFRRMAAELAHQINTPLIPILGMADLLTEDLPPGHPSREYAREIAEAAIRIRDITWSLADIAQQGEQE
jgi:DNA-binding response OmpR family regulator